VSIALAAEPKVLNPPIHMLGVESDVMTQIFSGLVRVRFDGAFEPDLADSYHVEDGGLTYRFKLRSGLRWQDGRPLTAEDFRFTYQTYTDPRTKTAYLLGWDRIERVETPDSLTVVYRMKEAFAPFLLDVAATGVLPRHVLAGTDDIRKDPFNRSPIGCGPFKLKEWQSASEIVLEANDTYFRGRPRLDRLVFKIVPDVTVQVNQLQAGEVDIVSVPATQWERVGSMAPAVARVAYDDTRYALVQLDQYAFLKDVRVRQALDYATPKRDIVQSLLRGLAVVAYADVPPRSPYHKPDVEQHDYDINRAQALLRQAGFSLQGGVMTKDGSPLEVPIYTLSSSPVFIQVAEVLRESWSRIGVRTSVTTMESSTLFSERGPQWNGRDAAVIFSWGQGVDPYNYVNWSSKQIPNSEDDPGENVERYVNPAIDDLVVRGAQEADFARRKHVYDQVQAILAHEVPVIFLYWYRTLYGYSARVRGFSPNAFAGPYWNSYEWTRS
jgi:peptide/nickel transport system substrate-binding protein